jgi:hypothetical protein
MGATDVCQWVARLLGMCCCCLTQEYAPLFLFVFLFAGMILDHSASYVTRKPILIRDRELAMSMEWDIKID